MKPNMIDLPTPSVAALPNLLNEICEAKRQHVAERKRYITELELREKLHHAPSPRGFMAALRRKVAAGKPALIAEIKKASPSKGIIRADFNPAALAMAYAAGGAACLSVLTDAPYFQGHDNYIGQALAAVTLPVLRKDFILEPYQVFESRALGADCILLIMAALTDAEAVELEAIAHDLGMDVLVEVHDEQEMERALSYLKSPLIGINNRNLKTLEVNLNTAEKLARYIPKAMLGVCESGIGTAADIARCEALGLHCFLVGESLMRQVDVMAATLILLGETNV